MKNLSKLGLLLILSLTLSSCQKIKSWFDVDFDTTLSGDLYIDVEEPTMKSAAYYPFHEIMYVDPLSDDDIAEYGDNITRIEATSIVATVAWVSDQGIEFNKGTTITVSGSKVATWELAEPWTLQVGDELTLGDDVTTEAYKKVTTMLTDKEKLTITADGECNQTGVSVTLTVGIDVKVTANPL